MEKRSVILTAERRVGKTCILRKMSEHPKDGWLPIFCLVESDRHPIDCVKKIFSDADRLKARSDKGIWLGRVRSTYKAIAGTEISGWKLPPIQSERNEVYPDDIEAEIRTMMDDREVPWFNNAAERIETYYANLRAEHRSSAILKMLSHEENFVPEEKIIDYVRSQMTVEYDDEVISTLDLLCDDNYIIRDTTTGNRRYRFRYGIMRRWWKINKG